jgi:hypothetical protein
VIQEIADIREPIDWMAWGIICAVCLMAIIAAGLVFSKPISRWLRRRRIQREFRRHLSQLESLKGQSSIQTAFFPGLNRIWRSYFDRDGNLALGSMTTTELRDAIARLQALDDSDRRLLLRLSESTDFVLYAGKEQPSSEAVELWDEVKRIMFKEFGRRREAAEL